MIDKAGGSHPPMALQTNDASLNSHRTPADHLWYTTVARWLKITIGGGVMRALRGEGINAWTWYERASGKPENPLIKEAAKGVSWKNCRGMGLLRVREVGSLEKPVY